MQPQKFRSHAKLVLASTSPRRKEILARLGLPFEIIAPDFEEVSNDALSAKEEALQFARGKARSVATKFQNAVVIGSDTLIACEGEKIGKPKDACDAEGILQKLQGRAHLIWTAVVIVETPDQMTHEFVEKVEVRLNPMTEVEIDDYIQTGEPLDKAGCYAVQGIGARFIQSLEGDRLAAIGLPLAPISAFLKSRRML
ncbi:MAG: Maf family protein [Nitrospiria bacterium]